MVQGHAEENSRGKGGWATFSNGTVSSQEESSTPQEPAPSSVRIIVELRMSNGLHISQKNLSYQDLKRLVEKLEVLC